MAIAVVQEGDINVIYKLLPIKAYDNIEPPHSPYEFKDFGYLFTSDSMTQLPNSQWLIESLTFKVSRCFIIIKLLFLVGYRLASHQIYLLLKFVQYLTLFALYTCPLISLSNSSKPSYCNNQESDSSHWIC